MRYNVIKGLNDKEATVLVVGAGFIGVEWATEIQHFFPKAWVEGVSAGVASKGRVV